LPPGIAWRNTGAHRPATWAELEGQIDNRHWFPWEDQVGTSFLRTVPVCGSKYTRSTCTPQTSELGGRGIGTEGVPAGGPATLPVRDFAHPLSSNPDIPAQ